MWYLYVFNISWYIVYHALTRKTRLLCAVLCTCFVVAHFEVIWIQCWGLNKKYILNTTSSSAFWWKEKYILNQSTLFLCVQIIISDVGSVDCRWTGDKPLPEPNQTQFPDAYMRHQSSMCKKSLVHFRNLQNCSLKYPQNLEATGPGFNSCVRNVSHDLFKPLSEQMMAYFQLDPLEQNPISI